MRQTDLRREKHLLKDAISEVQKRNNSLLVKATGDSTRISFLNEYVASLEKKVKILENENAKLAEQKRKLELRERNSQKLEKAVERLAKDKKRLLELMRQSSEFNLLGNLASKENEITFLHSLGFFSDYDVDKIQLANQNTNFEGKNAHAFNSKALFKTVSPSRLGKMRGKYFGFSQKEGKVSKVRECRKHKMFSEEQLWVDEEVRDFALEMKDKMNEQFSEELVEHLLFKLNSHFISKLAVFRKSGHLFCKFCKGTPQGKSSKNANIDPKMNFLKTLKNFGKMKEFSNEKLQKEKPLKKDFK